MEGLKTTNTFNSKPNTTSIHVQVRGKKVAKKQTKQANTLSTSIPKQKNTT